MLRGLRLNVSFCNGPQNELAGLLDCKRRKLEPCEFIQMLPNMADLMRPVRAARDPDWNFLGKERYEPGHAQGSARYMIKRHRLVPTDQMREQPVFALDDVELVMAPSQLCFQTVANPAQIRCIFAD